MNQRYLGIIPARGGSKGIPRKNIQPLGDKPLLAWTVSAALNSQRLDRTIFTSDDEELIDAARKAGAEIPFRRPSELATSDTPMIEVVLHALDQLESHEGYVPDVVVLLQPTSPFRDGNDIDRAIGSFESSARDTLFTVSPVLQHPCEMVRQGVEGRLEYATEVSKSGSGRQAFPEYSFINGAIYVATVPHLRVKRTFADEESAMHEISAAHGIDIDDPFQMDLARGLVALGGTT